jgi:hypothetical protein
MFMDLHTIQQLTTLIRRSTRTSECQLVLYTGSIAGHICVLAGGGEDAVGPAARRPSAAHFCTGGQRSRYLLMQIAVCVAFARACRHSERVLYGVPWPPSDVTR